MRRLHPETVHTHFLRREVHGVPDGEQPDFVALVPALGLVPGVDPFVLLDGEGWDARMLAFGSEYTLTIEDVSPFEELRRALALEGYAEDLPPSEGGPALFGYLSYDAARYLERLPILAEDDLKLPVARCILPRYVVGIGPAGAWISMPTGEKKDFILRAIRRALPIPDPPRTGTLLASRSSLSGRGIYGRSRG